MGKILSQHCLMRSSLLSLLSYIKNPTMKKQLHKLRRLIQKWYISLVRMTTPHIEKSEYERDCIAICKKLISKEDTILLLTPISNKRYIRNEELQIFVILEGHNVKVINHVYSYTVFLEQKEWITLYLPLIQKWKNVERSLKKKSLQTLNTHFKTFYRISNEKE